MKEIEKNNPVLQEQEHKIQRMITQAEEKKGRITEIVKIKPDNLLQKSLAALQVIQESDDSDSDDLFNQLENKDGKRLPSEMENDCFEVDDSYEGREGTFQMVKDLRIDAEENKKDQKDPMKKEKKAIDIETQKRIEDEMKKIAEEYGDTVDVKECSINSTTEHTEQVKEVVETTD